MNLSALNNFAHQLDIAWQIFDPSVLSTNNEWFSKHVRTGMEAFCNISKLLSEWYHLFVAEKKL